MESIGRSSKRPPFRGDDRSVVQRAAMEFLEQRRMLIAVVGDSSFANQPDTFLINRSGTTGRVFVNGSGTPAATWDVNAATPVTIQGIGGDDVVTIDLAGGNPITTSGLSFDGGTGNDRVEWLDSSSAETFTLAAGLVQVGGRNGTYTNSESLYLRLGNGTDNLSAAGNGSVTTTGLEIAIAANGTLRISTGATLPNFSDLTIDSGGRFDLAGVNASIDTLAGTGQVKNDGAAATLTIGAAGGSSVFGGALNNGTGTLSLFKSGSGRIELAGGGNFSGTTTIDSGILRVSHNNALGSTAGNTNISGGATLGLLELAGNITVAESFVFFAKNINNTTGLIPATIINVDGTNTITGIVSLNSGGTGYTFQSDAGSIRFVGDLTRVDSSAYHRPFQLTGSGSGFIDGTITATNATWGMAFQKFGAGAWMVGNNQTVGNIRVDSGLLTINRSSDGPVTINGGSLKTTQTEYANDSTATAIVASVTVAGGASPAGKLDLGNNSIVIDYSGASTRSNLEALVAAGYNGGTWTGPGITSSAAGVAANATAIGVAEASELYASFPANFLGKSIDNTSVVLQYTLSADFTMDGKVDLNDFTVLAANFGVANRRWFTGDANYDGQTNLNDFTALASVFGQQLITAPLPWAPVPAANFAGISPSQFTDDELRYAQPLYYFSQVANAVVETGPTRGFIDISVWRDPVDNQPYNARVLENHVAFAFFYSQNRSWNPYFGNQQVKNRLEAIMDYWVSLQGPAGTWPEYSPTNYSLAPTSFGLRTMVRTLELLQTLGAPAINSAVKQRVIDATIKGLRAMLADSTLLNAGNDYSNQYTAVYGTALTFGELFPQYQAELNGYLALRVPEAATKHQSPAGFMYEAGGPDWAYTLGTHQSQLTAGWHEIKGSPYQNDIVAETQEYYRWIGYNLIREPDGSGYLSNYGATTRTGGRFFSVGYNANPMTEFIPEARFLSRTAAEEAAALASQRSSLTSSWGSWGALAVPSGSSYTPGPFIDIDRVGWRPTDAQRTASVNALPYLASSNFNYQAVDNRRPQQFTFVRRPTYYTTFNSGNKITSLQRQGLGVIWNPTMGSVMQTQANSDTQAWGTRASGAARVYEGNGVTGTTFNVNGSNIVPTPGAGNLASGNVTITYPLGAVGTKTVAYDATGVTITVSHSGAFTEEFPLLRKSGETINNSAGQITLTRNGVTMTITHNGTSASVNNTSTNIGGGLLLSNLVINASGTLQYRISFSGP